MYYDYHRDRPRHDPRENLLEEEGIAVLFFVVVVACVIFCLVRFPKPLALLYFALIVLFTDSFPRECCSNRKEQVRFCLLDRSQDNK